jgi:hypothetical protein
VVGGILAVEVMASVGSYFEMLCDCCTCSVPFALYFRCTVVPSRTRCLFVLGDRVCLI